MWLKQVQVAENIEIANISHIIAIFIVLYHLLHYLVKGFNFFFINYDELRLIFIFYYIFGVYVCVCLCV